MDELEQLRAELEHYKNEKQRIRDLVGQAGGRTHRRRHMAINIVFLAIVLAAFAFDLLRHAMGWHIPALPPVLLLEVAVLLVSLKIIWMIHSKTKVDHFQFWILNSIEFQMNMTSRRMAEMERTIQTLRDELSQVR